MHPPVRLRQQAIQLNLLKCDARVAISQEATERRHARGKLNGQDLLDPGSLFVAPPGMHFTPD
jgi:hypothetical protein